VYESITQRGISAAASESRVHVPRLRTPKKDVHALLQPPTATGCEKCEIVQQLKGPKGSGVTKGQGSPGQGHSPGISWELAAAVRGGGEGIEEGRIVTIGGL